MTATERPVTYNDNNWGEAVVTEGCADVAITISGSCISEKIFRAYGISEDRKPLLIGVLEPNGREMTVRRHFTKNCLKTLGYYPDLPQKYLISEKKLEEKRMIQKDKDAVQQPVDVSKPKKQCPVTKDMLVNNALRSGLVSWEIAGGILTVYCEFQQEKEMPLAFAFSVCTIEQKDKKTVACFRCRLK